MLGQGDSQANASENLRDHLCVLSVRECRFCEVQAEKSLSRPMLIFSEVEVVYFSFPLVINCLVSLR